MQKIHNSDKNTEQENHDMVISSIHWGLLINNTLEWENKKILPILISDLFFANFKFIQF